MSVIHQTEIGLPTDRHNSSLISQNIQRDIATSPAISDLLSHKNALHAPEYHDSPATSQTTHIEFSGPSTQGSSLSSQEMNLQSQLADQANSTKKPTIIKPDMNGENTVSTDGKDKLILGDTTATHKRNASTDSGGLPEYKSTQRATLGLTHKLDTTAGQKRMANGEIKSSSSISPVNHLGFELSQLSNTSPQRSPQIGQLTAKLRTRLTYAMVKVQNGWESKTINEVENLAARQRSPRVSTTVSNSPTTSPQRKILASPDRPGQRPSPYMGVPGKRSPDSLSSSSGVSDTMESRYAVLPNAMRPSLAPPVDLGPRNPRRNNASAFAPPPMDSKTGSNLSDTSSSSIPRRINATPPTINRLLDQATGSQHPSTSMEQDAIETLLFMSSPGNTQYRSSSQQETNPSYSRPGSQLKQNNLPIPSVVSKIPDPDSIPVSPRKKLFLEEVDLATDQQIDKVLDEMPRELQEGEQDTSSDDSDDIIS